MIGSVRTYLGVISKIPPERENVRYYRGHGSSEYNLIPGIYRNAGWIKNESTMFHELMLRCPNDFDISGSTFNSLVKMQHYSLPTRLLDITANPLIALYFACEDEKPHDAEVIAFRVPKSEVRYHDSDTVSAISNISRMPSTFSAKKDKIIESFNKNPEIIRLVREIQREKPYFESRIESDHLNSVVCVKPVLDNPRIIKQDGAFLLFGMNTSKTNPAEVPSRYLASLGDLRMIIRGSDKRKILQQLELLGITKQSIYPEIEHVAGYIKNTYMDY
ncbi:FRG domain-containing protein [Pseudomonas sp. PL-6]